MREQVSQKGLRARGPGGSFNREQGDDIKPVKAVGGNALLFGCTN